MAAFYSAIPRQALTTASAGWWHKECARIDRKKSIQMYIIWCMKWTYISAKQCSWI